MNKTTYQVYGLHCKSCEILVEGEIKKIDSIEKVSVSYQKGNAEIIHSEMLDNKEVETAVKKAGYSLFNANENLPILKINKNDYQDLGIAFLLLLIIALLLDQFGIFNLNIIKDSGYSRLPAVILVGLTAGFSTCMALVGGILLALSASFSKDHPGLSFQKKFTPHLFFNLGRVFFFFILGGVTGLIGSILQISPAI